MVAPNDSNGTPVDDVRGLLSFDDCPSVLRASGLSAILQGFGRIFASAKGSERTYKMSRPVGKIDVFLSHNWVIPRWKKFLCLALHFNFLPAMFMTGIVLAIAAVLSALGYLPVGPRYQQPEGWKDPAWREGYICQVIALPVFWLVLFFWRDLVRVFGWRDTSAFLDKTCIHQEDPDTMRKGIERLGAFVLRSEEMLILYTETYLTKLWTSYEVAASITLHGATKMRVLPIQRAVSLICAQFFAWATALTFILSHHLKANFNAVQLLASVLGGLYIWDVRNWKYEQAALEQRVKSFRVQDCTCVVEADRVVVYRNISSLMRASNSVPKDSDQELALEAFNQRVRHEVMGAFRTSLGIHTFKPEHYVVNAWLISGGKALDMLASLSLGLSPRYTFGYSLMLLSWALSYWILFALLGERLAAINVHWRGWKGIGWILLSTLCLDVVAICTGSAVAVVREKAETSDLWLGLHITLSVGSILCSYLLLHGWFPCQRQVQTSTSEHLERSGTIRRSVLSSISESKSLATASLEKSSDEASGSGGLLPSKDLVPDKETAPRKLQLDPLAFKDDFGETDVHILAHV